MHQLTLAEIARGLADKKFSSEELTKTLLARIAQLDPQLNSFITLTEDLALEQAIIAPARAPGEPADVRHPITLNSCVPLNAHQSPRIVKQGSANRFNFARSFLNLKFDVRIPWLYSHNQSPALVRFDHSMIINSAGTTRRRWRTGKSSC